MQDFFDNVSRWPRFVITITLGIFFFLFERIKPLFKNPLTGIAIVGLLIAAFTFVTLTLKAMFGLTPV
jgi:hypothetical protein